MLKIEQSIGTALQTLHDAVVALASRNLGEARTIPAFVYILGAPPKGADTRNLKDAVSENDESVKVPVQVVLPTDSTNRPAADGLARIYLNDRLTPGSEGFYLAALHGAACVFHGRGPSKSSSSLGSFYHEGFKTIAAAFGLGGKNGSTLDTPGEQFRKSVNDAIGDWPTRERFGRYSTRKGGENIALVLRIVKGGTLTDRYITNKKGEPASFRLGKDAALQVIAAGKAGYRFAVEVKAETAPKAEVKEVKKDTTKSKSKSVKVAAVPQEPITAQGA